MMSSSQPGIKGRFPGPTFGALVTPTTPWPRPAKCFKFAVLANLGYSLYNTIWLFMLKANCRHLWIESCTLDNDLVSILLRLFEPLVSFGEQLPLNILLVEKKNHVYPCQLCTRCTTTNSCTKIEARISMVFEAVLDEFTKGGRSYRRRYISLLWAHFSSCCFQQIRTIVRTVARFSRQIVVGQFLCCKWFFSWLEMCYCCWYVLYWSWIINLSLSLGFPTLGFSLAFA